jgi:hypothetical protein
MTLLRGSDHSSLSCRVDARYNRLSRGYGWCLSSWGQSAFELFKRVGHLSGAGVFLRSQLRAGLEVFCFAAAHVGAVRGALQGECDLLGSRVQQIDRCPAVALWALRLLGAVAPTKDGRCLEAILTAPLDGVELGVCVGDFACGFERSRGLLLGAASSEANGGGQDEKGENGFFSQKAPKVRGTKGRGLISPERGARPAVLQGSCLRAPDLAWTP